MMRILFAGAVIAAVAAAPASAGTINHGDFDDIPPGVVMYLDVTESANADTEPNFGVPTIAGNVLEFMPDPLIGPKSGQIALESMVAAQRSIIRKIAVTFDGAFSQPLRRGVFVELSFNLAVSVIEIDGAAPGSAAGARIEYELDAAHQDRAALRADLLERYREVALGLVDHADEDPGGQPSAHP